MIVDGKSIAAKILKDVAEQIKNCTQKPSLVVLTCAPNFETRKYLDLKQSKADDLGISMTVEELPADSTTDDLKRAVEVAIKRSSGVIVQLPLPKQIDTVAVLSTIPPSHDVDAFSYTGDKASVLPPVTGAIAKIANEYKVEWEGKKVVVFGQGRLVGRPAAAYAKANGAEVVILTENSTNVTTAAKVADIIILGVGQPNLLTPDMVKDGVVVFDAGASEDGGLLVGDADPAVAKKSSVFTPVPGGIGPMTIALLFYNLLELHNRQ